jgi:hydrogenase/urease accessory protein HupE
MVGTTSGRCGAACYGEGTDMIRLHGPRVIALLLVVLAAMPAFAHPGHGKDGGSNSLAHYATEPVHVAPVVFAVLAGIATAGVIIWLRRRA